MDVTDEAQVSGGGRGRSTARGGVDVLNATPDQIVHPIEFSLAD
jgi:hypothetical protein